MKIISLVKKDLKLFLRDKRTLILTIIAPIIIMLIFGFIFNNPSTEESITGIKIGLCNYDTQKFSILTKIFDIIEYPLNTCKEKVEEKVTMGELRGGVIIPKEFSKNIEEGIGSSITLYTDASKSQISLVTIDSMKAIIQDLNEKIGTTFIKKAWEKLDSLNSKLKVILPSLMQTRDKINYIQSQTSELHEKINKLDTKTNAYLKQVEKSLKELNTSNLTSVSLPQIDTEKLELIYSKICTVQSQNCLELREIINTISRSYLSTQQINTLIANYNLQISQLIDYQLKANEKLTEIKSDKEELLNQIKEIQELSKNYSSQISEIITELEQTSKALDEYTSKDPINIVRPVSLKTNIIFGEKTYFEFLAPGLIAILLLFITLLISSSNIVNEKNTGTLARNFLSPLPKLTFFTSKIFYLLILCMIQLFVMFIIIRFMGIKAPFNLSILTVLIIMSINFILLGLLIGSLSKTENTSLLSSLVIGIPMMFLSGLFFPFEIMPEIMKNIGSNLPLTLSISSLEKIMTYKTVLNLTILAKLIVLAIMMFILTFILIRKRPESE